jgi:putative spermidine/putrescine transport system substrate-binding protein
MKLSVNRVALSSLIIAAANLSPVYAQGLTVTAWGGSSQAAQKKVYYDPFSLKTGIKILEDSWSGGLGILRTKVKGGNANWDLVQVEADEMLLGCEEGLLEKIDWSKLSPKEEFIPGAVSECGVGSIVWSSGLVYDADKLKVGPKNWVDFWDLTKFPGKRTMRKGPKYTLEFALMADGVPAADVYKVLSTDAGVNRAFKKLDQIKSNIVWWSAGAQGPQLLASGEVAMGAIYISRAIVANQVDKKNFQIVWPQSIYAIDYYVILKGSRNKDNALQLIKFATTPEIQKDFPALANQGITTIKANAMVTPEVAKNLPSYPPNQVQALSIDVMFWVDNIEKLTTRFNSWASQ